MTTALSTPELLARLQRHYIKPGAPLPGGVFLPEVGWNPAGGASGHDGGCDAIYVGFTSTRGRILVGHELKISRSDWLAELNKAGKADPWADQCHQWWLVVSSPAIVRTGELPPGWGLMTPGPSRTQMEILVQAGTKREHTPSWLAVRSIMARQDTLRAEALKEDRLKAREDARKSLRKCVDEKAVLQRELQASETARVLVRAVQARRALRLDDVDVDTDHELIDAICEVLEGRRLMDQLRRLANERLRGLTGAMAAVESSWQYRSLMEQLGAAAAHDTAYGVAG